MSADLAAIVAAPETAPVKAIYDRRSDYYEIVQETAVSGRQVTVTTWVNWTQALGWHIYEFIRVTDKDEWIR